MQLRKYQTDAIDAIKEAFKGNFRQYIELPTGSGKTVTFLAYAKENHKRILVIVPSRNLLNQVYETALLFYDKHQISRKGDDYYEMPAILHICIINSIKGDYLEEICRHNFDLTVIDEAHHSQADSYRKFIKTRSIHFKEKNMLILGVTATPDRADGQLLKDILYTCSFKIGIADLIEDGYLSNIEGFCVKTKIDINDVSCQKGDFNLRELYKKLCVESRNDMIIDILKKEFSERKTLIFCINIQHSQIINKLANSHGLHSAHIDGKTPKEQRSQILSAFRDGHIRVLCNCQLLTEGFDEPSIDGIILARPTRSRSLFSQMIGRGLRIFPGKQNCKIIDIVDTNKYLIGFGNIFSDEKFDPIESFKSIKDIKNHLEEERMKIMEYSIERTKLINDVEEKHIPATESIYDYLKQNNIIHFDPLSLDEGSFLIWYNKIKERHYNGVYS